MRIIKIFFVFIIILFVSFIFSMRASAALIGNTSQATLSISPSVGKYNVGDNFTASVYLNTNNQNVVVVAAYIKYDQNHLEATSIDVNSSVFSFQAENTIDAQKGLIMITRGIPTPGVNTSNGLIAKINFRAVSNVTPVNDNVSFVFRVGATDESNVILDDGRGTDILTGVYGAKYQIGDYSDGALLKAIGDSKVYVIDDGQKRWIPTVDIFNANGYNWANIVEVLPSVLDSIASGPDIKSPVTIPEGSLIRAKGDIDVWIVKYVGSKKFKRLILSPSVFNSYRHLHWSDIKEVDQSVVDSFDTSNLVRAVNDPKVYHLFSSGDTGEKRWIKTQEAFTRLGFDWDSVYQINAVDRDSYITGEPIE